MKRTAGWLRCVVLAWVVLLTHSTAHAQFNAPNQTNTISGVVSNWAGFSYNVGSNTTFDLLLITGGGGLSNWYGFIGWEVSASNNTAVVEGPGSTWTNSSILFIGYSGAGSRLMITNGGLVDDSGAAIGENFSSSNNLVLVDGTGSVWSSGSSLIAGDHSLGNQLVITNGGQVFSGTTNDLFHSVVGGGTGNSGSNTTVVVTGTGSAWFSAATIELGCNAPSNRVSILNGGMLADTFGVVGDNYSSNNVVLVDGNGSVWSNQNGMTIGYATGGNRLIVSGGGAVFTGSGFIGYSSSASNDAVLVTGCGSVWSNGADLNIGYQGTADQLTVADQGLVLAQSITVGNVCGSQGSLTVAGGEVVVTNASHTAFLEVLGGTVVVNSGTLLVDTLVITNACGNFIHTGGTLIVGSLVLDPNLSATGDGLPNWWKQKYGLDPLSTNGVNGANGDPDGDGMSNLQEYLAGTDPTNGASVLRITSLVPQGSDVLLTWTTAGGHTNIVQAAPSPTGSYSNISPNIIISGSGDTWTNYLDPGALTNGPARLYRIALVP